ncbi:hypothetical protein CC1G_01301 [Coprinopsis cinerea okayama7|uniref:DUF6534 domain-containing protein n=1 Tax=Coprinopsis cinerea (strain Okayama-7 / 130 / ATCC MYA-4618 / FGSC 9003) TaxID=240176 RepID=A8NYB8_COPC7|nr:hypothetical protein CC1G_01301 [Coprinopsis cinerea okayama7\|eukprot:XP_001837389.2 hypothetical protein CC1G_01301 [Coprinopsis cinerea okayama7\
MSALQDRLVVDNTMGASMIGVICASVLYGVSCVQTWYYFNHYRKDVWYIKSLVGAVWMFDTIHQILISHTVYYYVITNYNNPSILNRLVWSILLEVLFNGFIGLLVQGFLTLRVWKLSDENIPLTVVISLLVLAEFACSAAFTVESLKLRTWEDLGSLKGLSISVNIIGVVADVVIAGALFYFLQRSRTGFKKSDSMISRLILAWGQTLIYVAFYFSIGRLYSNSVLATLNARKSIRGLGEDSDELSFSLQSFPKSGSRPLTSSRPTNISIKIDTMQEFPATESQTQEPESAVTDGSF